MSVPEKTIQRALTMVAWFDDLPDNATTMTDSEIAINLDRVAPGEGWVHQGAPYGNATLVRSIRRWIDHQHEGEFADYQFNTRHTGPGKYWVHMKGKQARVLAATIGTAAQIDSAEQLTRRMAEERARVSMKLIAQSESWFQLHDYQRTAVCRDAANEYEQTGHFRDSTKLAMDRLGLSV